MFIERGVTDAILEILAHLPETHRNIFVWNHYRGYQVKQIAEIMGCGSPEVEATLGAINSILYQRTRTRLAEDPPMDATTNLSGGSRHKKRKANTPSSLKPTKWVCGDLYGAAARLKLKATRLL